MNLLQKNNGLPLRFALALFAVAAQAQTVRWDPPGGSIPIGRTVGLHLVFENCAPKDIATVHVPQPDDLVMEYVGNSSNTININGNQFGSETLNFAAALTKDHPIDIPAFSVETTKGTQRVAAVHFEPTAATIGGGGRALSEIASARFTVNPATV